MSSEQQPQRGEKVKDLRGDVMAECEKLHEQEQPAGEGRAAFNPTPYLKSLDAFMQKAGTFAMALPPNQYTAIIQGLALAIHAAVNFGS